MRHRRVRIGTAAAVGLLALGIAYAFAPSAGAATAQDTERVVAQEPMVEAGLALTDHAYFNNPKGTAAEQYAIRDHLVQLIQNTPAGAVIRVAIYNIWDTKVANELLAAKGRGVAVRMVIDSSGASGNTAVTNLINGLGTSRSASSWVVICTTGRACIGDAGSPIMHNKFYLFSSTAGYSNVLVQSSANLNSGNSTNMYNNALQLVGNTGLYNGYVSYFDDLASKVKNNDYYRTVNSGNAKAYFFPRAGTTSASDTIYNALNDNITCPGNTSTGTSGGNTIIRIAMWSFTRQAVADKIRDLADKNCWIQIVYHDLDAGVQSALSGHSRIYLFKLNTNETFFVHSKYMAIEGTYAGVKDTKLVFTGSHNYTNSALRENDEALIKITSNALHDQYRSNFWFLRDAAGG